MRGCICVSLTRRSIAQSVHIGNECSAIFASTSTEKTLSFLENNIDPAAGYRPFHGLHVRNGKGRHVYAPNPDELIPLAKELGIDDSVVKLLAQFAANRDGMRELQERLGQEETRCHYALEGAVADPRLAHVLVNAQKEMKENTQILENLANATMDVYHEIEMRLGTKKTKILFDRIKSQSIGSRAAHLLIQNEQNEKSRKAEREMCERGLHACEFPEGLPENCAAYLNMRVSDILKICPHPRRMEKDHK